MRKSSGGTSKYHEAKTQAALSPHQRRQLDQIVQRLSKGIEPDERGRIWLVPNYEEVEDFGGGASNEYYRVRAQARFEKWKLLVGRADLLRPTHDEQWLALRLIIANTGERWISISFPTNDYGRNFVYLREESAQVRRLVQKLRKLKADIPSTHDSDSQFVKALLREVPTIIRYERR